MRYVFVCIALLFASSVHAQRCDTPDFELGLTTMNAYVVEEVLYDDLDVETLRSHATMNWCGAFVTFSASRGIDSLSSPVPWLSLDGFGDEQITTFGYRHRFGSVDFEGSISKMDIWALRMTEGEMTGYKVRFGYPLGKNFRGFAGLHVYDSEKEGTSGFLYVGVRHERPFLAWKKNRIFQELRAVNDTTPLYDYTGALLWRLSPYVDLKFPELTLYHQDGDTKRVSGASLRIHWKT